MNKSVSKNDATASRLIDQRITELGDWRGKWLARLRTLVLEAEPAMSEEWKWDTPVWTYNGNVVAFGAFQDHVKLNFFKGASLEDPVNLFNAGLDAKSTRAIDIYSGDKIDETALQELVRAAAALNGSKSKPAKTSSKQSPPRKSTKTNR